MKQLRNMLFQGGMLILALALAMAVMLPASLAQAAGTTTVYVDNLQPSWTAPGGGGVFSAYIGPDAYDYVSPGATALYDGREAGIIKAGLAIDPTDGVYKDEGLLAFKVNNVDISVFAGQALTYDVQNETGANPVWVRIRLVGGTQYQFVPATNPAGWHTVDAAAGQWQLMDDNGNATGPMMSLADVANANSGATVDRVYLTLGMGDSYNVSPGVGTVGWVDQVTIGDVTYDFVVRHDWYVDPAGSDSNDGRLISPFLTIQKAVDSASAGDTIHVAAGTYNVDATITMNKAVTISGPTSGTAKVVGTATDMFKVFVISASNVTIQNLEITLATTPAYPLLVGDELASSLISVPSGTGMTGIIIKDNKIYVPAQTPPMTGWTARAITVGSNTVSNMSIIGNTIYNTRNGVVVQYNNTVSISDNTIYNTKGGIMNYTGSQADADNRLMSNNTWTSAHNEWDVVWNSGGGPYAQDYNKDVLLLSGANNDAYVLSLMVMPPGTTTTVTGNRSHVWVNSTTGTTTLKGSNGNMNLPYAKIQDGIDAVVPGGIVYVAAGMYPEQITIAKPLTLTGADGAVLDGTGVTGHFSVKDGTPTPPNGWTTGVQIRSGNVTFNNIDVTNYTQDGITAYDNIDMPNLHITNSKISNIQPGWWGFGIYVGYESEGFGYTPPDLTTHLDFSGLLIEGNEITNVHSSALVIQSLTGTPGTLVARNNNIHDNTTNDGIWIDCARNLLIENNTVVSNKWGVEFTCYAEGWYTLNGPYSPKDITLHGNLISNSTEQGIALYNAWPDTFTVIGNKIQGNGTGIDNFLTETLNATDNWWGDASGPLDDKTLPSIPNYNNLSGTGNKVSTYVDYFPWCADAACAELIPEKYTISFNSNGGSAVNSITQTFGTAVTAPSDPTKTGNTFAGWFSDVGLTTPYTFSTMPAADITLYAKWTAVSQTLTFESNGGTAVAPITQDYGTMVMAPTDPTKTGYTFAGWYNEVGLTTPYTFPHTMGLSTTIYAKWTGVSQTLTFESNGGTAVTPITQGYGTTVTAPTDPTKTGYTFAGWYNEVGLTTPYTFPHTMGLSTTIYAKWTGVSQTLTFESNGGTAVTPITQNYGTLVTAPTDPTRTAYTFAGWYADDVTFLNAYTFPHTMGLSTTVYAKWTAVSQTLSFESNGGTAVAPITQDYGTTVTAPADPTKTGYTFAGWYNEVGLTTPYTFPHTMGLSTTIYAKWIVNSYTISFNSNGGSAVGSITQAFGTSVSTPTPPTKTGYTFAGWYSDALLTTPYTFSTMPAANITLYAKWTTNDYTLTVNVIGSGSVSKTPNRATYHYGDIVQLKACSANGWAFTGWSGDLGGSTNPINITITGNKTVTATFVDVTKPDTKITSSPSNPSYSNSATFAFTGTDNATLPGNLTFECKLDGGAWATCTSPKSYSGLANGSHTFSVRAKDAAGNVDATPASYAWTVKTNQPPIANAGGPYSTTEGSSITLDASRSTDPDCNIVLYEWDLDNDGQFDDATGMKPKFTATDTGVFTVRVRVTDAGGLSSVASTTVTVKNSPPVISSFTITSNAHVGDTVNARVTFKDAGIHDTFTAVWNWGDGTTSSGSISNYAVTGSHIYTKRGSYTVTITITDKDGGIVSMRKVVVVSRR